MNDLLRFFADAVGLPPKVIAALASVAAALLIGSLVRLAAVRQVDAELRRQRLGSLAVWWVGLAVTGFVAWGGVPAGMLVFGIISVLGLREYFRLFARLAKDTTGQFVVYLAIPATYAGVWSDADLLCVMVVPVVGFVLVSASCIIVGKTGGYLVSVGGMTWGSGLLIFLLSHAVRLLALPEATNRSGGAAGWFVYLIVVTECDDIFQALWGRRFGRHKITPRISPNKSLEGLVGGVVSTLVAGVILAPWLTPLADPWRFRWATHELDVPYCGAVLACLLISAAGFLGDLNMSALKRDAGIKDTGNCLPGQGGVLDRIDSLTFAAPVFYYFARLTYS